MTTDREKTAGERTVLKGKSVHEGGHSETPGRSWEGVKHSCVYLTNTGFYRAYHHAKLQLIG